MKIHMTIEVKTGHEELKPAEAQTLPEKENESTAEIEIDIVGVIETTVASARTEELIVNETTVEIASFVTVKMTDAIDGTAARDTITTVGEKIALAVQTREMTFTLLIS